MRALRVRALTRWRFEIRCGDDGIGVSAAAVDRRVGALGDLPELNGAHRDLFGRGLRDVWLAQGARRIEGVRDGRAVESPARGDDPYSYLHVQDHDAPGRPAGSVVTVPLATERLPADGRLRTLLSQLVRCARCSRTLSASCGSSCPQASSSSYASPPPSPTRPVRCGSIKTSSSLERSPRP